MPNRILKLFLLTAIFLALPNFSKALAAEYYVATDGNDSNSGSITAPFKTFRPALTQVNPGDTIYVRGGTYGLENAMVSGTASDPNVPKSATAQPCPQGETPAQGGDGWYCNFNTYSLIAIQDFSGWASNYPAYSVKSGLPGQPITIKPYQGEGVYFTAPSDNGMPANVISCPLSTSIGCAASTISKFVTISQKSYWVIDGFDMDARYITGTGAIYMNGGNSDPGPTHDITIQNNNIHDYMSWAGSGNNVGAVKIDRGDLGGPYNIFIHNNSLHDMSDPSNPGVWSGLSDAAHFGAITTLSRQSYFGYAGGGTGYIEITGNTFYNLPSGFFFKNISAGPLKITDNIIHDMGRLGTASTANMTFTHNLVYNVSGPFSIGYLSDNFDINDLRVFSIDGQNAIVKYNTFVGLSSLFAVGTGTGHTVSNNIFFGLPGRASGANWNTTSFISKTENYNDPLDPTQSILKQIQSDNNCYITPYSDFQMVSRYLRPEVTGTGQWQLDHFDKSQALTLYGFDPHSTFITQSNPAAIFTNPSANDYHLLNDSTCPNMGYYAYGQSQLPITYGISDFTAFVSNWLKAGTISDNNSDNIVNAKDLGIVMSKWQ